MLREDYSCALKHFGEALSIRREINGNEPERLDFMNDLRISISNMSLCLRKLGSMVESYEFAEEAIMISERILDKSDDMQKSRIELVQRILEISELSDGLKKLPGCLRQEKSLRILKNRELLTKVLDH